MKKLSLFLLLAVLVLASGVFSANVIKVERDFGPSFVGFAQDRCLVVFKQGTQADDRALAAIAENFQVGRFAREFPTAKASKAVDEPLTRYYKAQFPEGNLEKVMDAYSHLPFVERVEPVGIYRMDATPNDYYYEGGSTSFPYDQWHYWDTYGVNANNAWDVETGDPDVIVAVVDGGVRYTHYELGGTNPPGPNDNSTNGNIWVNDGEIPGNGIDDDNNGYIDDVVGWDFVVSASQCNDADCSTPDNDPMDGMGHGTHVAGTIAAITNNDATWGVAGIAGGWNDGTTDVPANGVKIMCLRVGWSSPAGGYVGMDYIAEAFYYIATMVDKGYNVTAINCSWGSASTIAAAVDAVKARDVQLVVAAGNENSSSQDYLASRGDCIDVGATDQSGNPASFSNYGSWVDVAAPGVQILSTYHNADDPDNDYIALMDGTSMSCPHVTAIVGLLESYNPALTRQDKYDIITNPANMKSYNMTKDVGPGIADARKCLDAAGGGCDVVADFSGSPTAGCAPLTVNFTDLSTGPATSWNWTFGDGGSSTQANPSHQYANPGTYTVSLTVMSASCSDTETKTGYITVQTTPVADFSGTPTSGYAPLTVNFTDLSTGNPDTWSWNFGDNGTSTLKDPTHVYQNAGTYTVTMTASNACGSDQEQKLAYIVVDNAPEMSMHVSNITVTRITQGRNALGRAYVTVVDNNNNPLGGAVVYGYFNAPTTATETGTTGSDGEATLTSNKTKSPPSDWCFTVTDIVLSGYTYNDGANVVTQACESGYVYSLSRHAVLPAGYGLSSYPNPFNPTAKISFALPAGSHVRLDIFNIVGQRVATLAEGYFEAGEYSYEWDGSGAASGIYLYRLTTDSFSQTKQMVLMK